jgi:hypothetical protein
MIEGANQMIPIVWTYEPHIKPTEEKFDELSSVFMFLLEKKRREEEDH